MQIAAAVLREISAQILAAAGSSAEEAGKVATRLVDANLHRHDSHGVIRVPQYVGQVQSGAILPNQQPEIVAETDTVTVLDGHFGYGQIMGERVDRGGDREGAPARHRDVGAAPLGASRPGRRLAGDGGCRRHGVAAFRQRDRHPAARRAARRPRRPRHHQPDRDGHPGAGRGAGDPRLRDLGDRRGQGPGRAQQGRRRSRPTAWSTPRATPPPTRTTCTPTRPATCCRSAAR